MWGDWQYAKRTMCCGFSSVCVVEKRGKGNSPTCLEQGRCSIHVKVIPHPSLFLSSPLPFNSLPPSLPVSFSLLPSHLSDTDVVEFIILQQEIMPQRIHTIYFQTLNFTFESTFVLWTLIPVRAECPLHVCGCEVWMRQAVKLLNTEWDNCMTLSAPPSDKIIKVGRFQSVKSQNFSHG